MFKNVGKTLKAWTWSLVVTSVFVFGMIGLFVARWLDAPERMQLMFACVSGVIGSMCGLILGLVLYAFGELVDSITAIRKKLCDDSILDV